MLFPPRGSDLFHELFLFADEGGAGDAAASGGGAGGDAGGAAGGEAAAASSETPVTPDAAVTAENSGNAKPAEGEPKPGDESSKEPPANETPSAKAIREGIEARLAVERENIRAELATEAATQAAAAKDVENEAVIQRGFEATLANVSKDLQGLEINTFDKDGNPVKLSLTADGLKQAKVQQHLEGFKDVVAQIEEGRIYDDLAAAALGRLPNDEVRERFTEKAGGKDLGVWAEEFSEAAAPYTKWAKDTLKAHEAKIAGLRADITTEVEEFYKNAPGGMPSQRGSGGSSGGLTKEAFLAMSKDERARAWRERPDEVNALS